MSAAVPALRGLGGVGKTQLAVEYAHRHAADHAVVRWVDAEQEALVGVQLAALAPRLGLPVTGASADVAAVLAALTRRDDWLLVFDNAESANAIRRWLPPASAGRVIITSRAQVWGEVAAPVDVDVFSAGEAVAFLTGRVPALAAAATGGSARRWSPRSRPSWVSCRWPWPRLPLICSYMEATGMSPATYVDHFRARKADMLARGEDLIYGGTVDTCWFTRCAKEREKIAAQGE